MDTIRNYQKELEKRLTAISTEGVTPSLLLHSCCAPCSSYCLEYLSDYFHITIYYYNPNISNPEEYSRRVEEQKRLISELPVKNPIQFLEGVYEPEAFYQIAKGLEEQPEGGERCAKCYELRLREAASCAMKNDFDYFTTTLSISPHKNAVKLNEIGEQMGTEYGVAYLNSDFKKRNGYKRSTQLSKDYGLYRQDYCGCVYSMVEAQGRSKEE